MEREREREEGMKNEFIDWNYYYNSRKFYLRQDKKDEMSCNTFSFEHIKKLNKIKDDTNYKKKSARENASFIHSILE